MSCRRDKARGCLSAPWHCRRTSCSRFPKLLDFTTRTKPRSCHPEQHNPICNSRSPFTEVELCFLLLPGDPPGPQDGALHHSRSCVSSCRSVKATSPALQPQISQDVGQLQSPIIDPTAKPQGCSWLSFVQEDLILF